MSSSIRTVSIMVDITNAERLRQAAELRAVQDGLSVEHWREVRARGDALGNDVRMLLDPGEHAPPGLEIIDSSCD